MVFSYVSNSLGGWEDTEDSYLSPNKPTKTALKAVGFAHEDSDGTRYPSSYQPCFLDPKVRQLTHATFL